MFLCALLSVSISVLVWASGAAPCWSGRRPAARPTNSRRMPRMRFGTDTRDLLIAFSEHAIERICERTVYDWRTFAGQGDAFAFLDNCVYFEDCTDARGEPSFVVYNSCAPHFNSCGYVQHVLDTPS